MLKYLEYVYFGFVGQTKVFPFANICEKWGSGWTECKEPFSKTSIKSSAV